MASVAVFDFFLFNIRISVFMTNNSDLYVLKICFDFLFCYVLVFGFGMQLAAALYLGVFGVSSVHSFFRHIKIYFANCCIKG